MSNTPPPTYPLLDAWEHDERHPSVVLLSGDHLSKRTAEDRGDHWYIKEWILTRIDGQTYWDHVTGFTISKAEIAILAAMSEEGA